jgi:hypothetical protein
MFERSVISHKKPIGLPRSTTPDKNIWVFVAQNFEHFSHRYLARRFDGLRSRFVKIVLNFAKPARFAGPDMGNETLLG